MGFGFFSDMGPEEEEEKKTSFFDDMGQPEPILPEQEHEPTRKISFFSDMGQPQSVTTEEYPENEPQWQKETSFFSDMGQPQQPVVKTEEPEPPELIKKPIRNEKVNKDEIDSFIKSGFLPDFVGGVKKDLIRTVPIIGASVLRSHHDSFLMDIMKMGANTSWRGGSGGEATRDIMMGSFWKSRMNRKLKEKGYKPKQIKEILSGKKTVFDEVVEETKKGVTPIAAGIAEGVGDMIGMLPSLMLTMGVAEKVGASLGWGQRLINIMGFATHSALEGLTDLDLEKAGKGAVTGGMMGGLGALTKLVKPKYMQIVAEALGFASVNEVARLIETGELRGPEEILRDPDLYKSLGLGALFKTYGLRSETVSMNKMAKEKFINALYVQEKYVNKGAPETGFHVMNMPSMQETIESMGIEMGSRTMKRAREIAGVKWNENYPQELVVDMILAQENPRYRKKLPIDIQEKILPGVQALEAAENFGKKIYKENGIEVNYKERVTNEIKETLRKAEKPEEIASLKEALDVAENLNYVHIPAKFWLVFNGEVSKSPTAATKTLKLLASYKREKFLTIESMIDRGVIDPANIHIVDIIGNYYRQVGSDIAKLKVINAAAADGLAYEIKRKKPEPKVDRSRSGSDIIKGKEKDIGYSLKADAPKTPYEEMTRFAPRETIPREGTFVAEKAPLEDTTVFTPREPTVSISREPLESSMVRPAGELVRLGESRIVPKEQMPFREATTGEVRPIGERIGSKGKRLTPREQEFFQGNKIDRVDASGALIEARVKKAGYSLKVDAPKNAFDEMMRFVPEKNLSDRAIAAGKFDRSTFVDAPANAPILKGWKLHPMLAEEIFEMTRYHEGGIKTWEKALIVAKLGKFDNPLVLPMYDLFQASILVISNPKTGWKYPKYMVQAAKDLKYKTENYYEARFNNVLSKPYANPMSSLSRTLDKIKLSPLGRALKPLNLTVENNLLREAYNLSFTWAWKGDEFIRMSTYNYCRSELKMSPRLAAEIASKTHGQYGDVPRETSRKLNHLLFTPTFKIAMGKLHWEMVNGAMKTTANLGKVSLAMKTSAKMLIGLLAVNIGTDTIMNWLGYETEVFGHKYRKDFVDDEGKEKENVITFSNPNNLEIKFVNRFVTSFFGNQSNPFKAFFEKNSWELNPLYTTTYNGLIKNDNGAGDKIYDTMIDSTPAILFKMAKYSFLQTFAMLSSYGNMENRRESREQLIKDNGKFVQFVLDPISFGYTRTKKTDRLVREYKRINNYLKKLNREGELTKEKEAILIHKLNLIEVELNELEK